MQQKNFFEDPKGVLEEIQRQRQLQQQQQQQQLEQTQQLSTLTATTSPMQPTASASTTPSPLAYPSTTSLSSDTQQQQQPSTAAAVSSRRPKPGILRLDVTKPRRSSGGSVEFRNQPQMHGAVSFFMPLLLLSFYSLFYSIFLFDLLTHSFFIHCFLYIPS